MLKDVILTALLGLPVSLPLGMVAFVLAYRCLKRGWRGTRILCFLVLVGLAGGMAYGILRFSGTMMFPEDNTISFNWFGASWRDEGFKYVYGCATFSIGIAAALYATNKQTKR